MNHKRPQPRPNRSAVLPLVLVALLVLLPVLYVLSIGPVYRFCFDGALNDQRLNVFNSIYAPLWWLSAGFPSVETALTSYLDWWSPPDTFYLPPAL